MHGSDDERDPAEDLEPHADLLVAVVGEQPADRHQRGHRAERQVDLLPGEAEHRVGELHRRRTWSARSAAPSPGRTAAAASRSGRARLPHALRVAREVQEREDEHHRAGGHDRDLCRAWAIADQPWNFSLVYREVKHLSGRDLGISGRKMISTARDRVPGMRVGVLASGSGTILEALLGRQLPIVAVVADRPCGALEIAREHGVAAELVERTDFGPDLRPGRVHPRRRRRAAAPRRRSRRHRRLRDDPVEAVRRRVRRPGREHASRRCCRRSRAGTRCATRSNSASR